jgi:hypothetical protein
MQDAQRDLQEWGMDWISYRGDSTRRLDVVKYNTAQHEFTGRQHSVDVLRRDERCHDPKWNANPYWLEDDSYGGAEIVPTFYLLPYYLKLYLEANKQP